MKEFKILHVEDDVDCNFLLTESLRKEKHVKIDWTYHREEVLDKLFNGSYGLIVCDGQIPGWENHYDEVLTWRGAIPICIYSAKADALQHLKNKGAFEVFSKASEGTHNLVNYIKSISRRADE